MNPKKVLITTGGTGGHVYPAQGLADQLKKQNPQVEILFIGGGLSTNRYFERDKVSFQEVSCSPIKRGGGIFKIAKGAYQSYQIIKAFQPDIVVGFGSYYTVPTLVAAKVAGIPIILHEANSVPGKVNKLFAPFVDAVGVHFPQAIQLLKGNALEVGMPLREGFSRGVISRDEALEYFGLEPGRITLLIFGGSQGAEAINNSFKEMSICKELQLIHLTGSETSAEELKTLYGKRGIKASVKAFERKMNAAWSCADLFLGRAGASTISEALEFEVPGILIPYPFATDNHQEKNADYLVSTVGGAIKIMENDMTPESLLESFIELSKPEKLQKMRDNMRYYKEQPSRINLCQLVINSLYHFPKTVDKDRKLR